MIWWLNRDYLDGAVAQDCPCSGANDTCSLADTFYTASPVAETLLRMSGNMALRDYQGRLTVDNNTNTPLTYEGPLASLTSRFSASASEIFAGANLILPQNEPQNLLEPIGQINPGQSLLEAAIGFRLNLWSLSVTNNAVAPSHLIAGDRLFYRAGKDQASHLGCG